MLCAEYRALSSRNHLRCGFDFSQQRKENVLVHFASSPIATLADLVGEITLGSMVKRYLRAPADSTGNNGK
jgi:hypothetical protein